MLSEKDKLEIADMVNTLLNDFYESKKEETNLYYDLVLEFLFTAHKEKFVDKTEQIQNLDETIKNIINNISVKEIYKINKEICFICTYRGFSELDTHKKFLIQYEPIIIKTKNDELFDIISSNLFQFRVSI